MKVIDIMQKVANKEIFKFRINDINYYVDKSNYICEEDGTKVEWYIDDEWLNMNAEIIEEDKKIEKIQQRTDTGLFGSMVNDEIKVAEAINKQANYLSDIVSTINEIIDKLNEMEKE